MSWINCFWFRYRKKSKSMLSKACACLVFYGHSNPVVRPCVVPLSVRLSEDASTFDINFWICWSRISGCHNVWGSTIISPSPVLWAFVAMRATPIEVVIVFSSAFICRRENCSDASCFSVLHCWYGSLPALSIHPYLSWKISPGSLSDFRRLGWTASFGVGNLEGRPAVDATSQ